MTVSVILPNYNHARFLEESIQAIYSQTIEPYEVIVIDDGSTDDSLTILESFQRVHKNLKILKNKTNLGPIASVNLGIELASGKYICFCAADDIILPNFLEELRKILEENPDVGFSTSDFCTFPGSNKNHLNIQSLIKKKELTFIQPNQLAGYIESNFFWIPTNATLYRTKIIKELGGLDESLKWMSDWFLNYQISFKHSLVYLPKALALFRISLTSYSLTKRSSQFRKRAFRSLFLAIEEQPKDFQKKIKDSGLLYQQGKRMLFFLLVSPQKWSYFMKTLKIYIRYKLKCNKKSKSHA